MSRPFETDYAGWFPGHAKTREGAILAAMRHITLHGYNVCTITDKRTNEVVARVKIDRARRHVYVETVKPLKEVRK